MLKRIRSYTTWSEENGVLVPSVEPENKEKNYDNGSNQSSEKKLKFDDIQTKDAEASMK